MNDGLEALAVKRKKWVDASQENGFEEGIKKLLTWIYPYKTHFIYELLQNAEDTHASVVRFTLGERALDFEHNGPHMFSLADVNSITGMGISTKRDDPTNIGKFGVGFKAVFAYTDTPEIRSGDYHFCISNMVVPDAIDRHPTGKQETVFTFPFDHPKKTVREAVQEISQGLTALNENTLLFLRWIGKIEYLLPDGTLGIQERIEHGDGRIEIRSSTSGGSTTINHWLRFEKSVNVKDDDAPLKDCHIAIAYRLEADDESKKKKAGWKIVPLDQGQVSIFFPAEKETSNLRFHLHAPFASTVSRDSVRDCGANSQLRDHLATLVVKSLGLLKDQGRLDVRTLAVLPLSGDKLPKFYEPIRLAIVKAFQNRPLTPTRSGVHAPASLLYRGPAAIQDVIGDEDLTLLTDNKAPLWAKNPSQGNQRAANFLADLSIDEWGWSELARKLEECCGEEDERVTFETWIGSKDDAWLFRFNALLGQAQDEHGENIDVADLRFVRVATSDGKDHVTAGEAYFPPADDVTAGPDDVYFVKPATYASGGSESRKRYAKSFLDSAGVRPFDEKAVIERTLALYGDGRSFAIKTHIKHIREFVRYWKNKPVDASLFRGMQFLADSVNNGRVEETYAPFDLCLDLPFEETGLIDAHAIHDKSRVWSGYQVNLGVNASKDFVAFLKIVGVMYELVVKRVSTRENPQAKVLRHDYFQHGVKQTNSAIDEDYTIENLVQYLSAKSASTSRLVWNALIKANKESATAWFRPNQRYKLRSGESQLVAYLKRHAWIPDKHGEFRTPQDLTREDLRDDFLYDDHNGLLTAIEFGASVKRRSEEYQVGNRNAQALGFASISEAEQFAKLKMDGFPPGVIRAMLAKSDKLIPKQEKSPEFKTFKQGISAIHRVQRNCATDTPTNASAIANPVRYQTTLDAETIASVIETKTNPQIIRFGLVRDNPANTDAREFLYRQYQGSCQVHGHTFIKADGKNYFVAVTLVSRLGGEHLNHPGNMLCLSADTSAKFLHASFEWLDDLETKIGQFKAEKDGGSEQHRKVRVRLAGHEETITWSEQHFMRLVSLWNNA